MGVCQLLPDRLRVDSLARLRECVLKTAESQSFVKEKNNRNEHPQINEYLKACGFKAPEKMLPQHKAWCAAFVTWVYKQCGISVPSKSGAAAVLTWNSMTAQRIRPGEAVLPADAVTYKQWSHIELIRYWPLDPRITYFYTTGGNTTAGAKQHGVYVNIQRSKSFVRNTIRLIR
ncbi:hypothetical protein Runsl_0345 [Runella slithyformis DSM 19594]|uniref:CHAP domain-containing protein n=1 Tax=Runella slithyformis (strain ATCC 29530 / DSM 19594 / LMG 11500 / NCIMB 11436 / LSU 4) TaxID=761193 RepID=A0A7U3ZGI5_RUNSL|nr:hypothetical protein Runsl_0345 [Runella slithyformis DSM 19594]